MNSNQIFDKHTSRLKAEGLLKAGLCGIAVACAAAFIASFVLWLTDYPQFWIAIVIGLALGGGATALFYAFLFRPSPEDVAKRIDRFGLQERIITMRELEGDDSYIARRQREDALAALNAVGNEKIKFRVSKNIIVLASVLAVLGVAMTLVNILSTFGFFPKADSVVDELFDPDVTYTVTYLTEGGGEILGEPDQIVVEGESTTVVVAVAEEGWAFVKWSDDNKSAERFEFNVIEDMEITAIFQEADEDEGEGEGDGEGESDPGDDENEPSDDGDNDNDNDNQDPGDGPNQGGSANNNQDNTFEDGNKEFKDFYDEYYQKAMQMLAEGKDIPPDLRAIIESYFGILLPGTSGDGK